MEVGDDLASLDGNASFRELKRKRLDGSAFIWPESYYTLLRLSSVGVKSVAHSRERNISAFSNRVFTDQRTAGAFEGIRTPDPQIS